MKSAVAWNVKGIGHDARETAREAARRAGLSVGEWLNTVIVEAAGDVPHGGGRHEVAREAGGFSAIQQRLNALQTRLGDMPAPARTRPGNRPDRGRRDLGTSLPGLQTWLTGIAKDLERCGEETPQRVADALDRLNARLDQLIVSGRTAAGEFERRVAAIDHALDELNGETLRAASAPKPWPDAADDAANEIAARQRALDDYASETELDSDDDELDDEPAQPSGGRIPDIERELRVLSSQLEMLRRPCTFEDAVGDLRRDLGHIGDALAKAMPRCALDQLESEVQSLATRVDSGRHRGPDATAFAAIEQRLGKVHDVLTALTPAENVGGFAAAVEALSHKVDALASNGPDVAAMQHLETAIVELRGLTGRVASGEALATLATEVRMLAERIDGLAGPANQAAVSSLEQRVEALGELINARTAEAGQAESARLEALIGALSVQLERLDFGDDNQAALGQIESQVTSLAEKINASDARLGNVEMIERGLADLFLQIEETRANAIEAAEFKRDLADLRLTQTEADRRIQHMLEAVQSTVGRLADRLAMIETGTRGQEPPKASVPRPPEPARAAPAQPATPVPPVKPAAAAAPPGLPGPAMPTQAPERVATIPPAAAPAAALEASLPADHPLEPGSGAPRGRAATPAERIAASEAALGPTKPVTAPQAGEKANFIAAARRAAQAAAAESAQADGRRSDDSAAAAPGREAGEKTSKFRRPLFMSVAALLVVAATHVALSLVGSSTAQRSETSRQAANDIVPPVRDTVRAANVAAPTTAATAPIDNAATKPPTLVPGNQLLAPTPVANSPAATPAPASTAAAAPRQDAKPAAGTSPWDLAAINARPTDVTGSVPKGEDSAALGAPAAAPVGAPTGDALPAAIGGPGLRSAAATGNPSAAYEIAIRYAEGRGVAQSFSEAARWFERAAAQGLAPAQYRLGSFYEKGHGVKKDLEAARRLYISAAEKGNARAMHNLAVLYAEGIDGKPEYKTASQWFRKAATHGVADSQYNLGILYARGIGVEQNFAESYKWFALAAQQGDQDAGRKRDDVGGRLDPQSLVAAKLAAQTFTPESQPEEATTVKPPAGGWERPAAAAPAASPAKQKPAGRRT